MIQCGDGIDYTLQPLPAWYAEIQWRATTVLGLSKAGLIRLISEFGTPIALL